jgi:hypothetical protein
MLTRRRNAEARTEDAWDKPTVSQVALIRPLAGFGGLAVPTIFWPDWIEALTGYDPDERDGTVEGLIVIALLSSAPYWRSRRAAHGGPHSETPFASRLPAKSRLLRGQARCYCRQDFFRMSTRCRGWRKRELLSDASVAGLALNSVSVFFRHAPPRRVLNKILKPRNAVKITVHPMLILTDLEANSPAFL